MSNQRDNLQDGLFFVFVVLGVEPRALHMLNKSSTTEPTPQHVFELMYSTW
jgi:hypothetical protein